MYVNGQIYEFQQSSIYSLRVIMDVTKIKGPFFEYQKQY